MLCISLDQLINWKKESTVNNTDHTYTVYVFISIEIFFTCNFKRKIVEWHMVCQAFLPIGPGHWNWNLWFWNVPILVWNGGRIMTWPLMLWNEWELYVACSVITVMWRWRLIHHNYYYNYAIESFMDHYLENKFILPWKYMYSTNTCTCIYTCPCIYTHVDVVSNEYYILKM